MNKDYKVISSSPDSCSERFTGTREECEQWVKDNKHRFPRYVMLKIQPAEESAKWERDFDIHSGESIYEQMNKIDDNESFNEKCNMRTLKDVKKLQESTDSDMAVAWYVDSGAADEEAEEWCEENPEDWNISDPRFVERAIDWYESSYYSTLYDDDEELTEALTKEKPARSLGYAYTLKDIRSNATKIANETNKHKQKRDLKDLTSGCRVTIKEVDDLIARLNTYSDALHTFVNSSRTDADATTLADALKNLSI